MNEHTDEPEDWPLRDWSARLRPPGRTEPVEEEEPAADEEPAAAAYEPVLAEDEPEILFDEES